MRAASLFRFWPSFPHRAVRDERRPRVQETRAGDKEKSESSLSSVGTALLIALVPAILGYVYTSLDNKRKERLEYVRHEIANLYGPLYTLSATNDNIWKTLVKQHKPVFVDEQAKEVGDMVRWRSLVKTVILPINQRMEEIILKSGETFDNTEVPEALLEFLSFSESLKNLTSTWMDNDLTTEGSLSYQRNIPDVRFPKNITECLKQELHTLRLEQEWLEDGFAGLAFWKDKYVRQSGGSACQPTGTPAGLGG